MATLLLALLMALLLMPSANYHQFSGLPLNSLPEFLGLVALFPVIIWPWLRAQWRSAISSRPPWQVAIATAVLCGGVLAKGVMLADGGYEGFPACYRSVDHDPPSGLCEKSYDNPLGRFTATRIDRTLDFGPPDWNLSFFNSLRFNYCWWVGGSILRERIPFTAFWRGSVEFPTEQTLDVTYVGEGQVSIGQNRLALKPAYDRPARTRVRMPAGQHNLVVAYRFDDGYRSGMSFEPGPLATFRLTVQHPAGDAPLAPRSAPIIW